MSTGLEEVLGYENLLGVIQDPKGGVPDNILPPEFNSPALVKPTVGNTGTYTKVASTRRVAQIVAYGSASRRQDLAGVTDVPVKCIHSYEHVVHDVPTLQNLRAEDGSARQRRGKQTVARQTAEFRRRGNNLRLAAIYSAFGLGKIYVDSEGNMLHSSSGKTYEVDFGIPSGNQDQLDVLGDGSIIDASWATAGTDIGAQIRALKTASRKLTGYEPEVALYGSNIPGYFEANTNAKNLLNASPALAEAMIRHDIPKGFNGLDWYPAYGAFFVDKNGTKRDFFGADTVVFMPRPSADWFEIVEGTFPVPTDLTISGDAAAALENFEDVQGMFSYAELATDPPGIKQYGGDTFLPCIKVPGAVFIADVTP